MIRIFDIREKPTVRLSGLDGIDFPCVITSPCIECCFIDWSMACQNPNNPKDLEKDYSANIENRETETLATIAAIKARRADGTLNAENFIKFVDEHGPSFHESPVKGLMLCGLPLGDAGGRALQKLIEYLPKGCLKSISIIGTEIGGEVEKGIIAALMNGAHPVSQGHQNSDFTRSDGTAFPFV